MKFWNVWETVFHDTKGDMSKYDYVCMLTHIHPEVVENILYLGSASYVMLPGVPESRRVVATALRIKIPRYRDVAVTVRVEIPRAATYVRESDGTEIEDQINWFGITTRALTSNIWSAYLFYIRKNGRIEFGIHEMHDGTSRDPIVKTPDLPEVAAQPVTLRIKVEGDCIQTWANDRQRHDERDRDRRFIRQGDIYLITYGVQAKIHEVEVKVKKWYAPFVRVGRKIGKTTLIILAILSGIAGLIYLYHYFIKPS